MTGELDIRNRRRRVELPISHSFLWKEQPLVSKGCLLEIRLGVKATSHLRKVRWGRSVGATGDGSKVAWKAARGVLLQSWG